MDWLALTNKIHPNSDINIVHENNSNRKEGQYSRIRRAVLRAASFTEEEMMFAVVKNAASDTNKENRKLVRKLEEKGEGIILSSVPVIAARIVTIRARAAIKGKRRKDARSVSKKSKYFSKIAKEFSKAWKNETKIIIRKANNMPA